MDAIDIAFNILIAASMLCALVSGSIYFVTEVIRPKKTIKRLR